MANGSNIGSGIVSKDGKARAAKMTLAQRKENAKKAAEPRWSADPPRATHASE